MTTTSGGLSTNSTSGSTSDTENTSDTDPFPVPEPDGNWTRRGGSLSVDLHGWTNNPTIAEDGTGTVYAAWLQHLNPTQWELSGVRVAMWRNGAWTHLGGRIASGPPDATWGAAYDPSLAVVDGVPYVAWYEGSGYGWGGNVNHAAAVFVSHWDGSQWTRDSDATNPIGALNTEAQISGRNPRLTSVQGVLHTVWIEHLPNNQRHHDRIVVKRLDGTQWNLVDTISFASEDGLGHKIIDVAAIDLQGQLHVAWTEYDRRNGEISGARVHVAREQAGQLVLVGQPLNRLENGRANYLDMAQTDSRLYVAWQEKTMTGAYQIYVSHWDGDEWVPDAGALGLETDGDAGRPALEGDASGLWLAWTEGGPGQRAQLRARHFDGASWSTVSGSLNRSTVDGAADAPEMAIVGGIPHVVWTERDFPSATKQVYVTAADTRGDNAADVLTQYGADGPILDPPDNTWVIADAGGITEGAAGVGDEGYSSINYVPAIERSLVFGKYHAIGITGGEDQNALLAYDSLRNRWDIVEITEAAWSEHLPGIGHDEGHVAIEPERGLYITHGNLTLHGGTRYQTYVYDTVAGRGRRMLPEGAGADSVVSAGAFDTRRGYAYMAPFRYDLQSNRWDLLPGCGTGRWSEGVAYDPVNDVMVQFGGHIYGGPPHADETRIIDLQALTCTSQVTTTQPPAGYAHLTYNSRHGVIMALTGGDDDPPGQPMELWIYNGATRTWSSLGPVPVDFSGNGSGQKLTYDATRDLLLFHNGGNLRQLRVYRYVP